MTATTTTNNKPSQPKLRRFLLARHGETNYNKEHRIQGTLDDGVFLNYDGIAQASALGVYVAGRQLGPPTKDMDASSDNDAGGSDRSSFESPITRTYCSPMQRCRQTYAAISGVCSGHMTLAHTELCSPQHSYHPLPEPIILPSLREIELCEWQGRLRRDVAVNDAENWNIFKSEPTRLRLNDGTFAPVLDCWERGMANWEKIRSESVNEDAQLVFIMCHGAIGQAMLLHSLGMDVELYGKSKRFAFDNCDCFEIEWCDTEMTSRRWRRVHPMEGKWETCSSTKNMYSSSGLLSSR
ncbi:hypothetical protein HJC23_009720 [Cyclotella cryptica]|uniref:Phosphoglycerate mutase-like protein n=1 Tax=Cyclotella cryptica TaxID=29204 RepID=A0ABD3NKT5_9STRA|eukprot:CCRYP_020598-RA/>CCRYP_020598-RA protein AED:0.00 eAED:0.00 QI:41/-1/1/1/-1/1/1/180/295